MVVDDLFDFECRDIFATAPDAILDPVDKEETPLYVKAARIAGVKPYVALRFDSTLWHLILPRYETSGLFWAADNLPGLAAWDFFVRIRIYDPNLEEIFLQVARAADHQRVF